MANERILVVDDEEGVVKTCVRILERQGYRAIGLSNSSEAQSYLQREAFDLLLTDIRMPDMDGLKLLNYAKTVDPHLSVVLFTGYGTLDDAMKAMRLGAQGFVLKPFDPEELVAVVSENLQRRALLRDSLRLQTLLPLLEVSNAIQQADGAVSMMERALSVAQSETGATRLQLLLKQGPQASLDRLVEVVAQPDLASRISTSVLQQVLETARPAWLAVDGTLRQDDVMARQAVAICLPLAVKAEVVGVLTAETADDAAPFGHLALDLLAVLGGQLAIAIENINLFHRIEALRVFNEDIIENMTNGLIALDLDGRITAFNRTAAALLDCAPEAVIGHSISIIEPQAADLVDTFRNALKHHLPASHREATIFRADGSQVPVSVSVSPLRDESQAMAGVVGVVEDLTELKTLEAERRRLDRLAALGEMSAVVAHEIRNPIAAVSTGVDYITRHLGEDSPHREGAQMILGEIERINRILEDILFVARPLHLSLKVQSLPDIIDSVVLRSRAQIEKHHIEVACHYQPDLPLLKVDRTRLEQVFTNLLINAIQAMPQGGRVNLHVTASDSNVKITFKDDGPGIPAPVHARVFEPFFTTKARGTGLGLAVARRVIEEHGGALEMESSEGKGTTFLITLPLERTPVHGS